MGLLDNVNTYDYYRVNQPVPLEPGGYQFVTLDNIINAFMVAYVGENKILTKVNRTDVQFHGMRAIQELSYDVFRSIKSHEIEVPDTLRMILPMDYVNYIKVVRVDDNGIERILYPTSKSSNPFTIKQESDGEYFVGDTHSSNDTSATGNIPTQGGTATAEYNMSSASGTRPFGSKTLTNFQDNSGNTADLDIDARGRRYGLDPQHAQANGTYIIDNRTGFIHFGSSLAGETIILKYVSDGLGSDEEMVVHKFCEEAIYKWIMYGVLSTRSNIPQGIIPS